MLAESKQHVRDVRTRGVLARRGAALFSRWSPAHLAPTAPGGGASRRSEPADWRLLGRPVPKYSAGNLYRRRSGDNHGWLDRGIQRWRRRARHRGDRGGPAGHGRPPTERDCFRDFQSCDPARPAHRRSKLAPHTQERLTEFGKRRWSPATWKSVYQLTDSVLALKRGLQFGWRERLHCLSQVAITAGGLVWRAQVCLFDSLSL